jgi:hypothetical protein
MGLGDQIAQNFIENNSKTIDFIRTIQFTGIGFFISVSNIMNCIILKNSVYFFILFNV